MTIKNMTRMTGGRLLLLAGLATLSLTGCKSLYGDYERPEVKTDGIVRDPVNDRRRWREATTSATCRGEASLPTRSCNR